MKKISLIIFASLFYCAIAFAQPSGAPGGTGDEGPVEIGVPLDGGFLSLLLGAGVAYFLMKKKKIKPN